MAASGRYSIEVDAISQQELDLLECLLRIDQGQPLDGRAGALLDRMVEAGLVDAPGGLPSLTVAGIERCRSLQHRIAADSEAAKVLAERGLELADEDAG
jgi:hypothetical protein